ncbi:MAG TPA: tetratricopeptide repeat protein [Terriglobia bacterium]|nr:tetratricopeptide repeat protein [Terriglobia bacterium]
MVRTALILWALLAPLLCHAFQLRSDHPSKSGEEAAAHLGKGYEYVENQNFEEAAREFKAALSLSPALTQARFELAICEFALYRFVEARGDFAEAGKEAAVGRAAVSYYLGRMDLVEGNPKEAVRRLSAIASTPPFEDTLFYLGSAYLDAGDLKQAKQTLIAAAKSDPRDFRIPDHLARAYQKEKRPADAERGYTESARLREYYDQGAAEATACGKALESDPLPQARLACQRLSSPSDSDKLTLLGMLYGRHGDYQDALPPLEAAPRLDPNSWEVSTTWG